MRPRRDREIIGKPQSRIFAPVDCPFEENSPIILSLDEYEALRLADLEGMYHQQAAEEMNVSRQTFGRIIKEARRKMASHIIECRRLIIKGGDVVIKRMSWKCHACGRIWEQAGQVNSCPDCGQPSPEQITQPERRRQGKGRRFRRHGQY